jgi:hypothetical protein
MNLSTNIFIHMQCGTSMNKNLYVNIIIKMNECKRSRATTRTRFIYIYTHNVKYEGRSMESENILFVFIYKSIGYAY